MGSIVGLLIGFLVGSVASYFFWNWYGTEDVTEEETRENYIKELQKKIRYQEEELKKANEEYRYTLTEIKEKYEKQFQPTALLLSDAQKYIAENPTFNKLEEELANYTPNLNKLVQEVADLLDLIKTFERWNEGMVDLKENNNTLYKLNEDFSQLGRQTSILSLNAGIEAAKSGEAGLGFRVVAIAINKLSNQIQTMVGRYKEELDKNDLITTVTFQDIQAGSRMILTAVDVIHILADQLDKDLMKVNNISVSQATSYLQEKLTKIKNIVET